MTDRRSPAWRLLILMIGAIALLGLVAAAACNDDDDGGDGDGDPTATQDDGDGDGDGDGSSLTDLANFGEDYESFNGKVTYNIASFTGNDSSVVSMTIYQKDGLIRWDMSTTVGDVIEISTPDGIYSCTLGQCILYPPGSLLDLAASGLAAQFSADAITNGIADIPDGVDVDVTGETIAGIDATCFKISGDLDPDLGGDESSEFCFSDGGLLLRRAFQLTDGVPWEIEATSASNDVLDSDFDPPWEVTDLSDLGDLFP